MQLSYVGQKSELLRSCKLTELIAFLNEFSKFSKTILWSKSVHWAFPEKNPSPPFFESSPPWISAFLYLYFRTSPGYWISTDIFKHLPDIRGYFLYRPPWISDILRGGGYGPFLLKPILVFCFFILEIIL